jgi:hypothetical protein
MKQYESLVDALSDLRGQGYTEDFNLKQNCLECRESTFKLLHDEFQVDAFYRFEGMTDPDDESIVYAISSTTKNIKGVLVSAYGAYSEPVTDEMMKKLTVKPNDKV